MTLARRSLAIVAIVVLLLVGVGWFLSRGDVARLPLEVVTGAKPRITEARAQTVPTIGIAKPIGWHANETPIAAPGLQVAAFARGLDHPRWLYELPNGDVLVAETNSPPRAVNDVTSFIATWLFKAAGAGAPSPNRIMLLRDTNGDGVADLRTAFLSGLDSPYGMALVGDRLYVGNHDALVAFPYTTGVTRITTPAQKIVDLPGGGQHWAKNIVAAPDGQSLYIAVGSSSNIGDNGMDAEVNRANILQLDLKKKSIRIFAAGLRNPVGMAWEPRSQALWTSVNERDMLGSDLAPDYMTRVEFGAFYGWPYSYWGGYEDARVEARPDLLQYTKRPDYALGPHTASLGLAFASLGPFTNGAFVGQHGSWNRKPLSGYKVVFVPFGSTGFPNGQMRDVLTGFLDSENHAHGRPVGVLARTKGDLLVADDVGNAVWRVSAK